MHSIRHSMEEMQSCSRSTCCAKYSMVSLPQRQEVPLVWARVFPDREHFAKVYFGFAKKLEKEVRKTVRERGIEAVERW